MKNKKIVLIICIVVSIAIIGFSIFFMLNGGEDNTSDAPAKTEVDSQYKYNTQIPTNSKAPVQGDVQLDKIDGYTPDEKQTFITLPHSLSTNQNDEAINIIDIVSVGSFTGELSNGAELQQVDNCLAVVIKNPSDKVLSVASVSVEIDKDTVVSLSPTNIPPNCSCLVFAENYDVDYSTVKKFDCTLDYAVPQNELPIIKDKVGVDYKDGQFIVTNLTNTDLGDVYIRFKEFATGNVYFGPTHSVFVKDVKPYETYKVDAPDYIENDCVIVAVENYTD